MKRKASTIDAGEVDCGSRTDRGREFSFELLIEGFKFHKKKRPKKRDLKEKFSSIPDLLDIVMNPRRRIIFLKFSREEDRDKALPLVQEMNSQWTVTKRRWRKKRKLMKKPPSCIEEVVSPLWKLPYTEQLEKKKELGRRLYLSMWKKLRGMRRKARFSIHEVGTIKTKGFLGEFLGIIPSPITTGYRNNTEYTCGVSNDQEKCVGFLLGSTRDGITNVANPDGVLIISPLAKAIRVRWEKFIRTKKDLDCYSKLTRKGFWRMIKIRENVDGECIILVQVHPQDFPNSDTFKSEIVKALMEPSEDEKCVITVKGILLQKFDGLSNAAPDNCPVELIFGVDHIIETVLGKKFKISPKSFFQVNTKGAEILYGKVKEWLIELLEEEREEVYKEKKEEEVEEEKEEKEEELLGELEGSNSEDLGKKKKKPKKKKKKKKESICLLDVCCGTGTIGQILMDCEVVKSVVGIDISASSIADAKENGKRNNIDLGISSTGQQKTLEYVCGPAEKTLGNIIFRKGQYGTDRFVAIVDPPRGGLHKRVVQALRTCRKLEDVIYVSCKMENCVNDVLNLCKDESGQYKGKAFVPRRYVVVDMFPHCNHYENIMHLHRDLS